MDTSQPPVCSPDGSQKLWSVFCHLSTLIGVPFLLPLVVYLVMRNESRYVATNAAAALNFHLSTMIYCVACIPLIFLFGLGGVLIGLIVIVSLVLAVMAAVRASHGEAYQYPFAIPFVR